MDLDAYTAAHRSDWERLDELSRTPRLTGEQSDELIMRYQSGATQLSAIKTTAGSTAVGDRLSVVLSRVRLRFTGAAGNALSQLPRFFMLQLPAALYRLRWLTLAVTVATVLIALAFGVWISQDPRVLANLGSESELSSLARDEFVAYYSENPAASFAGRVWTNNAWIAAQCIAFGITGVWVPYVVLQNAQNLGITGAVMFAYDKGDVFFLFIAPHGQLELTCIFVAAAAGLRIFWSWVAPGRRTRLDSIAHEGRSLITVVVGLVIALFVSGIIEGFVTPWPLQEQTEPALGWAIKIGIGTLALAAFLAYMLVVGRRAARHGETGDLDAFGSGATTLTAA
ncbi:stage II sporulation protein M [Paramicrobacterium agarici]|uniref:Putative membrane protein SpoIIM required for sporulation n=1 Tax=Paramicrobacterium agarici TaxID=630514 RepID=A0A2A9DWU9_9MICO|nr:stage II sporulation protein M [Microbacterium agarici]PFG30846.1 putative membrane protein SpoIIM required for sporulation [Microbacterium agarici]